MNEQVKGRKKMKLKIIFYLAMKLLFLLFVTIIENLFEIQNLSSKQQQQQKI